MQSSSIISLQKILTSNLETWINHNDKGKYTLTSEPDRITINESVHLNWILPVAILELNDNLSINIIATSDNILVLYEDPDFFKKIFIAIDKIKTKDGSNALYELIKKITPKFSMFGD